MTEKVDYFVIAFTPKCHQLLHNALVCLTVPSRTYSSQEKRIICSGPELTLIHGGDYTDGGGYIVKGSQGGRGIIRGEGALLIRPPP